MPSVADSNVRTCMTQQSLSGAADVRGRAHAPDSFTVLTRTTEWERKMSLQGTSHLPDAVPTLTMVDLVQLLALCPREASGRVESHPPRLESFHPSHIHRDCIGLSPHQTSVQRTQKLCVRENAIANMLPAKTKK